MSEISLNECEVEKGSDIGNNGGQLVCNAAHGEGIPAGTYTGSCTGCRLDGIELKCNTCSQGDGGDNSDVTPVEAGGCEKWGNSDGQLSCEDEVSRREGADVEEAAEPEPEPESDSERKEL